MKYKRIIHTERIDIVDIPEGFTNEEQIDAIMSADRINDDPEQWIGTTITDMDDNEIATIS